MGKVRKYFRKKFHSRNLKKADRLVSDPHFDRETLQTWEYSTQANIASVVDVFSTAEYARMEILQQLVLGIPGLCNANNINDDNITKDNKNFTKNHIFFIPSDLSETPFNKPDKKSFSAELLPGRERDMGWLSNTHVGAQYLKLQKCIANIATKIYDGDYDNRPPVRETKESLLRFLCYIHQKLDELLPLIAGDQSQNLTIVIEKLTSLASLCAGTRRKNLFCGEDKSINYPEDEPAGWVQYIAKQLEFLAEAHSDYNSNLSLSESLKNSALYFSSVVEEFGDLLRQTFVENLSKTISEKIAEYPVGREDAIFSGAGWEKELIIEGSIDSSVWLPYAQSLRSFCKKVNNESFEEWACFLGEAQRIFYDPTLTENPFVGKLAENIKKFYVLPFLKNGIQKLLPEHDENSSQWINELSDSLIKLFKYMWEIRIRIASMERLISLTNKIGELNFLDIHEPIQADLQILNEYILSKCCKSLENFKEKVVNKDKILDDLYVNSTKQKLIDCFKDIEKYCDSTFKGAAELYKSVYDLTGKITNALRELPMKKLWCRNEMLEISELFHKQAKQGWEMENKPDERFPQFFTLSEKKLSSFRNAAGKQGVRLSRIDLINTVHSSVDTTAVKPDHDVNSTIQQPRRSINEEQLIALLFINLYNYANKNMSTWGFKSSRLKKREAILSFVGVNPSPSVASQQATTRITDRQCATALALLLFGKIPQSAANDDVRLVATNMCKKLFHKRFLGIGPSTTEKKIIEFRKSCGSLITEEAVNNPEVVQQARALAAGCC